jgi:hypothetical protein
MRPHVTVFLLLVLGGGCAGPRDGGGDPAGQLIRIIDGRPLCPECEVVLKEVVVLGHSADPFSVREDGAGVDCLVGRLSTGEFLMSGPVGGGHVLVYDSLGRFLGSIGRPGQGPGEFGRQVRLVVGRGDTVFALDDAFMRVQRFTHDGQFLGGFPFMGQVPSFALLDDGSLLLHRLPWQPEDHLFHLLSPTGEELAKFGTSSMEELDLDFRVVSPSLGGGFWTASLWRYEAHLWEAPGILAGILRREVDWFPSGGSYPEGIYERLPPPPFFQHIWEDGSGRLWTYAYLPDPDWRPGLPLQPRTEWFRRTFDTRIELIDLGQARLIASGTYETRLARVCNSHLMYTVLETEEGDTRVQVLEPVLMGAGVRRGGATGSP